MPWIKGLPLAFLVSLTAASPLGATCSCSVTATLNETNLVLFGRSSGACEWWSRIRFAVSGLSLPYAAAERFGTSCSLNYPTSSACLRTGFHTATAHCQCGKSFPGANGSFYCAADPDKGTAETLFFVNTTPTVGISFSGPDAEGTGTLVMPYSFPNTIYGDIQRKLTLSADGLWLADAYGSQVSGTWTREQGTSCWSQGNHQIKIVAVACGQPADAAYRAEAVTTVAVNHQPSVSLSLAPLDPADPGGLQVAAVAYSFPQTAVDVQRRRRRWGVRASAASPARRAWDRVRVSTTWPAARAAWATQARPPGTPSSAGVGPTTTPSASCRRRGGKRG